MAKLHWYALTVDNSTERLYFDAAFKCCFYFFSPIQDVIRLDEFGQVSCSQLVWGYLRIFVCHLDGYFSDTSISFLWRLRLMTDSLRLIVGLTATCHLIKCV
jgi:hypothetical protein